MELGSLQSNVELLAAVLDLKAVQSVVKAMRAVDTPGANNPVLQLDRQPGTDTTPEPRYEPRRIIHPTPQYAPRPIVHPELRIEQKLDRCDCAEAPPIVVKETTPAESPIQPPWKCLPWKFPLQTAPKVKAVCYHPDIIRRGMLLDLLV